MQSDARGKTKQHDEEDDDGVDRAPAFTEEDEVRERAQLSIGDIASVVSDLHGMSITTGLPVVGQETNGAGRASESSSATRSATTSAAALLHRLDDEMSRLDTAQTAAYRRAVYECPDQLTDERKLAFLETENGDATLAAIRLARYWEFRLDLFCAERCFLPMTLDGAMKDEVNNLSTRLVYQLMPVTDTAGRAILWCVPSRRNFEVYSVAQEIMALFYLMETIIEDPDQRRRGVVALMDGRNMQKRHFSRKMSRYADIFDKVLPIRLRAHHLCHPSAIQYYVIVPASKYFSPKESRLRFQMHYGTTEQVLQSLEQYCLPRDRLPSDLGGTVSLDMNMNNWVLETLAIEQSRPDRRTSAASDNGPDTKRLRTENNFREISASSAPLVDAAAVNEAKKRGRGYSKGGGHGKASDPRMALAVELKEADPELPLYDALIGGGFVFVEDNTAGDMVDPDDGVTLRQRKNNLCRRIRKEKEKRKTLGDTGRRTSSNKVVDEQEVAASAVSIPESVQLNQVDTGAVVRDTGIAERVEGGNLSGGSNDATDLDGMRSNTSTGGGAERRDSFYEAIAELPGLTNYE